MKKAFSYIRMSTSEQLKGDSLTRQIESAERYAKEHDLVLDTSLQDIGVSAYKGKNKDSGALSNFLELVNDGTVPSGSILIVESLDRLSREEILTALGLFTSIINSDIEIVTLSDNQVYSKDNINSNFTQLIISLTVMSRAHEESKIKSDRIGSAWQKKRKNISDKPLTKICPAWLRLKNDEFVVIEDREQKIKDIFELAEAGNGKRAITKILNSTDPEGFTGKGWHDSYIQKILDNRQVLGEFQPHKKINGKRIPAGDPISDYYPQIISDELFYAVQKAKSSRKLAGGRAPINFVNIFSGVAKCNSCGSKMKFVNKGAKPKGGRYLVCANASRGLCKNNTHIRHDQAEITVIMNLEWENIKEGKEASVYVAEKAKLQTTIDRQQTILDRLLNAFTESTNESIEKKMVNITNEIADLKKQVEQVEKHIVNASDSQFEIGKKMGLLKVRFINLLNEGKSEELDKLRKEAGSNLRRVYEGIYFEDSPVPKKAVFKNEGG